MKKKRCCPYCGEEVLAEAVKCKHCKSAIDLMSLAEAEGNRKIGEGIGMIFGILALIGFVLAIKKCIGC